MCLDLKQLKFFMGRFQVSHYETISELIICQFVLFVINYSLFLYCVDYDCGYLVIMTVVILWLWWGYLVIMTVVILWFHSSFWLRFLFFREDGTQFVAEIRSRNCSTFLSLIATNYTESGINVISCIPDIYKNATNTIIFQEHVNDSNIPITSKNYLNTHLFDVWNVIPLTRMIPSLICSGISQFYIGSRSFLAMFIGLYTQLMKRKLKQWW